MDYVIYTLIGCNLLAFGLFAYARARLGKLEHALRDLDWEALAGLVGDVAVLKRTIQKLNMRLNGMETADPMAALAKLPTLQQNVTPIAAVKKRGG
tara:strand:- start:834 stop:1121 length:288 start_codon:yes stop_codon:yes gene_type:complete